MTSGLRGAHAIIATAVAAVAMIAACANPPAPPAAGVVPRQLERDPLDLRAVSSDVPPDLRRSRPAAMRIATIPTPQSPRVRAEAALHAALAAAGIDGQERTGVVGVLLGHASSDLHVAPVELVLRILARLETAVPGVSWQLGVVEGATVEIRIDGRTKEDAEVTATLTTTTGSRSRRQPVLATWDGIDWTVAPAGAITDW